MYQLLNKVRNASYLTKKWLADIHTKHLISLTTTKIRRELKLGLRINLTTKETSPYQNRWKENCPSSPDLNNQPTRYKIHQIQNDKERRTVPIIPNKEAPVKNNKLVTKEEIETDDISSAKPGPDKRTTKENPDVPDNDG